LNLNGIIEVSDAIKNMTSITEQSNPLSSNIDRCTSHEILNILQQVDNQMFYTVDSHNIIHSQKHIQSLIQKCSKRVSQLIHKQRDSSSFKGSVVFSGAGTSGRLSYFCAKSFNECLARSINNDKVTVNLFKYLVAGGYCALVAAQESAEDDPQMAVSDYNSVVGDEEDVVYVGITCGMSAPYVGGQLYHTLQKKDNKNLTSILLGFNPVEAARKLAIEKWWNTEDQMTFYKIAKQMEQVSQQLDEQFIILNPILDPEAITGSTRMKGGSGTKFLLDVIFATSIVEEFSPISYPSEEVIFRLLSGVQETINYTYQFANHHQQITSLIDRAAYSLNNNGSIYYIGSGNAGMVGFIDASECPPTYGAKFSDVRGFIVGGWESVFGSKYNEKPDMDQYGADYHIGLHDFERMILPNLSDKDTVIFLQIDDGTDHSELHEMKQLSEKILQEKPDSYISWISVSAVAGNSMFTLSEKSNDKLNNPVELNKKIQLVSIRIPYLALVPGLNGFGELSLKLVLNAITTGAHVLKGTIYGNRMINLRVSNNKLFYRAVGIICNIVKVDEALATKCLLRAIYGTDDIAQYENEPISKHISKALQTDRVVPTAMLLASGASVTEVENILQKYPVIRDAIQQIQQQQ
jgi:N-acetylmuramic acid 6-phosphate (MurNAc-6-P) etherase